MDESVKVTVAGHELEWNKLDPLACEKGIQGGANRELSPFEGEYPRMYGYGRAIEGACGCIRACMVHLEERRKIKNLFKNAFRSSPQWEIDRSKPYELTPEVVEFYEKNGKIEDFEAYITYNKRDNYGTDKTDGKVNPLID
ncbi:MAG: hypothetical protein BWX70_02576 [Verrucomicrobia bacterium ADurb.Bin070]|nr:MAG: hypothetical protein BWX70_02576 [Verrucomicrobia bacterium ADurb.Bin070]